MGINELTGTSWHIGALHKTDDRRHKSRCIYYDKSTFYCTTTASPYYDRKCSGSAHCEYCNTEYKQSYFDHIDEINQRKENDMKDVRSLFDTIKNEFPEEAKNLKDGLSTVQTAYIMI